VIPDPVQTELASLTPDQIQAIDEGWVACTQTLLPKTWTEADLQDCLATQLGVPPEDPDLLLFLQWAVNEGLIPESETSTTAP
jgi:hypothetical protein